jgi:hypothetical protein
MKKKELRRLAEEIASKERIIQTTEDSFTRSEAQNEVIRLTEKIYDMEDMLILDSYIQEFLSN